MSGRRRALVLLSWLAAVLAGLLVIFRAQFSADLSAFLPAAPDAAQRVLIEQLHGGVPARTLLLAIDGGSAAQRVEASRQLATALRALPLFEQVQNGESDAWRSLGEWVLEHRYLLSPAVDAQRFSAAGLREAIDDTLSLLGTPGGQRIKAVLERDPTGELVRIAENSLPTDGPRSEQGVWVSRDGERAVLLVIARAAGSDLDAQALAIGRIEADFAALQTPQLRLRLSGAPKFGVDSRAQIEAEARHLAIAGTVLVGALLLLAFGSAVAVGVAMLPVVSGIVAGIAAVALCFDTVFAMTLGFGSTLIGEAVDYGIYFLIQSSAGAGAQSWIRRSWPTVRLGLLASLCGFGALAFSGFPGLAQLGVFSMAGLAGAALTTRFVLPLLAPHGATGTRLRGALGRAAMRVLPRLPRLRAPLTLLGVAAAVLLAWQHEQLWGQDLSSLSPVPQEAIRFDETLRADLSNSQGGALVIVQAADAQAALQAAEQAGAVLDRLVAQGTLGGYQSAARLLPSVHNQLTRQAALPDAPTLRTALAQATEGGPLAAQRLQPFIDDVQRARQLEPMSPATLSGTALAPLLDALLLKRADGSWAALLPLQAAATPLDPATLRAALAGVPGAQVLLIPLELRRLYRHYLHEAQVQALLGALAVVALIAVGLRSWQRVRAVCQPLLLAVLLLMAALYLLAVPMGILHLVGLLLVVALGSNYALFFNAAHGDGGVDEDTLASLLLVSLTTATSFGLIALSAIPALSSIGQVVAPGTLLALLLAAAYAPMTVPQTPTRASDSV
ncbi:MAG: MMPL family transporter [Rubrivivax sp.]